MPLTTLTKDALVLCPLVRTQLENNILQARRLRGGPMDTADLRTRSDIPGIEDEIADLPPKYRRRGPVQPRTKVWIAVNQVATLERRRRLQDWQRVRVPRDNRVIVVEDGRRNHV